MAYEIKVSLNQILGPRYIAITTPYVTYQTIYIDKAQAIRPDVGVLQTDTLSPAGGVAVGPPQASPLI